MPSLTAKDRTPLCLFSYEDGRRCRTPRIASHPHFCFYHAQKESQSQSQSAEALAKELDYFFSGDYLSACDLSTAMGRLIPAVIRGHIKPRLARTVAYMLQTQLQAIHLSQHEYADAFGTEAWRKALRTSIDLNSDYLCPPNPESQLQQPTQSPLSQTPAQSPAQPAPHSETPPQSPAQPVRPTSVEAGLARPVRPPRLAHTLRPNSPTPPAPSTPPTPSNATPPQPPTASTPAPTQTTAPPPPQPKPAAPTRDPYAVHFDHNYRLLVNGNPF